jgi:hypothetical protein
LKFSISAQIKSLHEIKLDVPFAPKILATIIVGGVRNKWLNLQSIDRHLTDLQPTLKEEVLKRLSEEEKNNSTTDSLLDVNNKIPNGENKEESEKVVD